MTPRNIFALATLVLVLLLPLAPIATPAEAQTVLSVSTSRDNWGNIYKNQTFYVEVRLSSKPANEITITVEVAGTPYAVNATYVTGTAFIFRAWFHVDANGNLIFTDASGITRSIPLSDGMTVSFKYQDKGVSLTYMHIPATIELRTKIPYPVSMVGALDWKLEAPDLNSDPTTKESVTATVTVIDYTKGTSGTATVTFVETSENSGVFVLTPAAEYIFSLTGVSIDEGDDAEVHITVPEYMGATTTDTATAAIEVFRYAGEITDAKANLRELTVTVTDYSENKKSYAKENVTATIVFPDGHIVPITLVETEENSGIFTGTLSRLINYYPTHFNGTSNVLTIRYVDPSEGTVRTANVEVEFYKASVDVMPTKVALVSKLIVKITDNDLNIDPNVRDRYIIVVSGSFKDIAVSYSGKILANLSLCALLEDGSRTPFTAKTSPLRIVLTETGEDTGVFEATIDLNSFTVHTGGKAITHVVVVYTDLLTPEGAVDVSASAEVAKVALEADRTELPLTQVGNLKVHVTVTDPSANTAEFTVETVSVQWELLDAGKNTVYGPITATATETDINTGIFTGTIVIPASAITPTIISGYLHVVYTSAQTGETAELYIPFKIHTASIKVNTTIVKYGDAICIKVTDPDANLDTMAKDTVTVTFQSSLVSTTVTLEETEENSGIFKAVLTVSGVGTYAVAPGDTVKVSYTDLTSPLTPMGAASWQSESYSASFSVKSFTGELYVNDKSGSISVGPAAKLTVKIVDWDRNVDPENIDTLSADTVVLRFTNGTIMPLSAYGISLPKETDVSTGVFTTEFTLTQVFGSTANAIGKTFYVIYRDPIDANGGITAVTVEITVQSWDGKVYTDKTAYNVGDIIQITVEDPDIAGSGYVNVHVTSTSDPIGIQVTLYEVEDGVFEGQVRITGAPTISPGYIYARVGDKITITYVDPYPADYGVTGSSKAFSTSVIVGIRPEMPSKVEAVKLVDPQTGAELDKAEAGKPVFVTASVSNVDIEDHEFLVKIVVRDEAGVAVYLAYQKVYVAAGKTVDLGFGWTPEASGTYTVEVYVLKSLAEPTPLAETFSATIEVA